MPRQNQRQPESEQETEQAAESTMPASTEALRSATSRVLIDNALEELLERSPLARTAMALIQLPPDDPIGESPVDPLQPGGRRIVSPTAFITPHGAQFTRSPTAESRIAPSRSDDGGVKIREVKRAGEPLLPVPRDRT